MLTDDANLATRIRALATTAKRDHPHSFIGMTALVSIIECRH